MTTVWQHTFPPLHHIFHFSCKYLELFVSKCGCIPPLPSARLVSSPPSVSQRKGRVIVCFMAAGCRTGEAVFGHRAAKPTWIINMMNAKKTCQIYLSVCLTACILPVCLRYCLYSMSTVPVHLLYCLSAYPSPCMPNHFTACISAYLPVHLFVNLLNCLSSCLTALLPFCLSV